MAAAGHRGHRRPALADDGRLDRRRLPDLDRRPADRYLLRRAALLAAGLPVHAARLPGAGDPELPARSAGAVLWVRLLQRQHRRAVLASVRRRPLERGEGGRHGQAPAGASGDSRYRQHGPGDPHHARQPARRAAQAVRRDGARQGAHRVASHLEVPGAGGAQSVRQHDRLHPALRRLRQHHHLARARLADGRSAAAAVLDRPGHVPGRGHRVAARHHDRDRHADLRPVADVDRPADPGGRLTVTDTVPIYDPTKGTATPSPAALEPEETSGPTAPAVSAPGPLAPYPAPGETPPPVERGLGGEPLLTTDAEERVAIATQAQLMWRRFRKHRLAMVGAARRDPVLPGGAAGRISRLRRSRGLRRAARADRPAAGPSFPRWPVPSPCLRDGRRARSGDVQAGLHRGSDADHSADLLLPGLRIQALRIHPGQPAPDRGRRRQPGGDAFPARDRPGGARHVVAVDVRHTHVADDRSGRRGGQPGARRDPGRHLRLLRRDGRHGDPADHRDPALGANDPALDGSGGGDAEDLDDHPGLLHDHDHHLLDRLDRAGAGGPRPVPLLAPGRLRDGGRPGGREAVTDHLRAHGAALPQPHHRRDDAGAAGDGHQRDGAELPGSGIAATGHQLGGAPAAGAERAVGGALTLAAHTGRTGHPGHPGLQLPRRRSARRRRPVLVGCRCRVIG